jgi:di/tripeptidase
MFDDALRNGNIPYEEMINTVLESELAEQIFSEEEMAELQKTKDAGQELFRQMMEIYGKTGG